MPGPSCKCRLGLFRNCPLFVLAMLLLMDSNGNATTPTAVNIGALVSFNSAIGRVDKQAIELAVREINRKGGLLYGTKLVLHMLDADCKKVQGAVAATELLRKEVVAILQGPLSSTVSHFVADMADATQVPVLSFATTVPDLVAHRYPYFFSLGDTDAKYMAAVAAVLDYYDWKEAVVLHTDDKSGMNKITLEDAVVKNTGGRDIQKIALPPGINRTSILCVLDGIANAGTQVVVVHMQKDDGLRLLLEAFKRGMMREGYAWIVTDWDDANLNSRAVKSLQGIIGIRRYISEHSPTLQSLLIESRRSHVQALNPSQISVHELYAYGSVTMVAQAIENYLRLGLTFDFENQSSPDSNDGEKLEPSQWKVFRGGPLLRHQILDTICNGLRSLMNVSKEDDLKVFEIVNMVGKGMRVIGYWTKEIGLSITPNGAALPTAHPASSQTSTPVRRLLSVIWPGDPTTAPRGRVLSQNDTPKLTIFVPHKMGFEEFVNVSGFPDVTGLSIDIFKQAVGHLNPNYSITFKTSDAHHISYSDMIRSLANKSLECDGVVGDVTITAERMELVSFTQPYTESAIVMVVSAVEEDSNAWAFLRPFTRSLWGTIVGSLIFTAVAVWILEHKENPEFRGPPKKQIATVLWFMSSSMFSSQRESIQTSLGRLVVNIWLFVVLIITSSYTASLTSILTIQQISPTIETISTLRKSNVSIGYQTGSFVKDYLIKQQNITENRLKALDTAEEYAKALTLGPYKQGGVLAIIDELPYVQSFLSKYCGFVIAGSQLTKGGFGFAFLNSSQLALNVSKAILDLSANGTTQQIQDTWLPGGKCNKQVQSTQLSLQSFWGLFLVTGSASFMCIIIYSLRLLWQFVHEVDEPSLSTRERGFFSPSVQFIKSFAAYVDKASSDDYSNSGKKNQSKVAAVTDQSLSIECTSQSNIVSSPSMVRVVVQDP